MNITPKPAIADLIRGGYVPVRESRDNIKP
jgi:hypothetical protein